MRRSLRRNERGQILIFTMIAIVFLIVIAGSLASDVARMISEKNEIQSSLDAASLAAAGKLGFNDTVFPTVRDFAVSFADKNTTRAGKVVLSRNDGNVWATFDSQPVPYGDVILGVWDPAKPDGIGVGKRFEPSTDGTVVNSVMCRYKRQIPANFLSIWGLVSMNVAASAVATANPPKDPPSCVFPIALSSCPFTSGTVFTSGGCGVNIKFITSDGKADSSNTAAWVNMGSADNPSPTELKKQIGDAASGACGAPPAIGSSHGAQGGMIDPAFDAVVSAFRTEFAQSVSTGTNHSIKDSKGNVTYNGPGWEVAVPVLQTECNDDGSTKQISGTGDKALKIVGWTRMVMTQAWDTTGSNKEPVGSSGGCIVSNSADSATWQYCNMDKKKLPDGLKGGKSRSLWGFYACGISNSPPVEDPLPRAALANKLRLVR